MRNTAPRPLMTPRAVPTEAGPTEPVAPVRGQQLLRQGATHESQRQALRPLLNRPQLRLRRNQNPNTAGRDRKVRRTLRPGGKPEAEPSVSPQGSNPP